MRVCNYLSIYNSLMAFMLMISAIRSVATDKVKYDISWNPEVTEKLARGNVFKHEVTMGEYMDVICPQYDVDEDKANMLTFVIYNVTRDAFHHCSSKNSNAEKLLDCHTPTKNTKLTLKFQSFSPNPRGFIYRPDESYYLMAYDSDEQAINAEPDCSKRMRMEIIVHPKSRPVRQSSPTRHHSHPKKTTTTTTTTTSTTTSAKFRSATTTTPATTTTTSTTTKKSPPKSFDPEASRSEPGGAATSVTSSHLLVVMATAVVVLVFNT